MNVWDKCRMAEKQAEEAEALAKANPGDHALRDEAELARKVSDAMWDMANEF